jgi:benzoyl-CoA 2,3-dioxygenase component B
MPEYRWGILLAPREEGRKIAFGKHKGEPVWQEVPGEYRSMLRRLIVIQGDTEPASVEQQRLLGATAPSLYDMRNLFQVNVEEGRHLWAMVYLLQKYFGRDGREEAEALLERRSGDPDKPRILGAFNEKTPDWLSFFMFTTFTDRDGKMQLESLANSGFDPLARTTRFMLTEEGHHMLVGRTGVARVIQRTSEIEISTNAANAFNAGIKGRFGEPRIDDDHQLHNDTYPVMQVVDGEIKQLDVPAISAVNARLLDVYIDECASIVTSWNRIIAQAGIDFEMRLPHRGFNRQVGEFSECSVSPEGELMADSDWERMSADWLPSDDDGDYILSLMKPEYRAGCFAPWIAAPKTGIDGKPGDFEYVRIAG